MKLVMIALMTGTISGVIFSWAKLPLPAPPSIAGIAGIFGIFLGSKMVEYISKFL